MLFCITITGYTLLATTSRPRSPSPSGSPPDGGGTYISQEPCRRVRLLSLHAGLYPFTHPPDTTPPVSKTGLTVHNPPAGPPIHACSYETLN